MNKTREQIMKRIQDLVAEKERINQALLGMNMEERRELFLRKEAIVRELREYLRPSRDKYNGRTRAYQ